jgi:hypothetical protein
MKPAELELQGLECLLLAQEVLDPRQRQILRETGVSWLRVADQVKKSQQQDGTASHGARLPDHRQAALRLGVWE